jgi:lysozyme family protein
MNTTFNLALEHVLKWEGGFANHPNDPGGATMKGVTLTTYRRFFGQHKTVTDLRNISQSELAVIYRRGYWDLVKADQLPAGVDLFVFDYAVNSGPSRAIKELQRVVGLKGPRGVDGLFGPVTAEAVTHYHVKHGAVAIINGLRDRRMAFLRRLGHWSTFKRGWTNRVNAIHYEAVAWAMSAKPPKEPPEDRHPPAPEAEPESDTYPPIWLSALLAIFGLNHR